MSQHQDLIQDLSKETVAVYILSLRHRDALIVVQLFESNFFCDEEELFDIDVGVKKLLEFLVKHFEAVDMDEILDILETELEAV